MVKNIILTISILLNVAILVFAIWAYVMFNNGFFSYAMTNAGMTQLCTIEFEDEESNTLAKEWCEKMTKCMEAETNGNQDTVSVEEENEETVTSEDNQDGEVEASTPSIKGQEEEEENEEVKTVFTSANGQLTFEYKNDWICNEVVTGARVDCYPSSRNSELEDHGLDMPTVYYPDITIFISNCSASLTDMDAAHSYKFVQDLNGCKVLVLALETTFSSEEEAKTVFASSDETEEIIQKISEYCEEHNMPECPPTISHSVVDLGDEYSVVKVGSFNYLLTKKDNEWNVSIASQESNICDTGSGSSDLFEYCSN